MLCSQACLVNHGIGAIRAVTLRCRSWACPLCLPLRKRQLVRDACDGLPDRLLTLTTRRVEGADPDQEALRQGRCFARLVKAIRKAHPGKEVAYFAVREATKAGWPHLHVLLRAPYLDWNWLRATWLQISGSPGVDIRKIYDPTKAARYVAKYIGKSPHQFGTAKRYWSSRGWSLAGDPAPRPGRGWSSLWQRTDTRLGQLAETYWLRGWTFVRGPSLDYFEARSPP